MWGAIFAGMYLAYFSFVEGFSLNVLAYAVLGGVLFTAFSVLFGRILRAIFKALGGKIEE